MARDIVGYDNLNLIKPNSSGPRKILRNNEKSVYWLMIIHALITVYPCFNYRLSVL